MRFGHAYGPHPAQGVPGADGLRPELLCGEWVRPGGRVFLRVRKEGDRYLLDECWTNAVNSRVQVFTFRLLKDEQGNLYTETQERAIGYDRERDRLLADSLGEFERKKENDDET